MDKRNRIVGAFTAFMASYNVLVRLHSMNRDGMRITSNAFLVLYALTEERDGVTMTALASELGIMKQQLTRIVAGLEEMGYAERRSDPENHRCVRVSATKQGKAKCREVAKDFADRIYKAYFEDMTDEGSAQAAKYMEDLGKAFADEAERIREENR